MEKTGGNDARKVFSFAEGRLFCSLLSGFVVEKTNRLLLASPVLRCFE